MGVLKSYTAKPEDAGQRIDAVLAGHGLAPQPLRCGARRGISAVFVSSATVAKKHALAAGDTVVYERRAAGGQASARTEHSA